MSWKRLKMLEILFSCRAGDLRHISGVVWEFFFKINFFNIKTVIYISWQKRWGTIVHFEWMVMAVAHMWMLLYTKKWVPGFLVPLNQRFIGQIYHPLARCDGQIIPPSTSTLSCLFFFFFEPLSPFCSWCIPGKCWRVDASYRCHVCLKKEDIYVVLRIWFLFFIG